MTVPVGFKKQIWEYLACVPSRTFSCIWNFLHMDQDREDHQNIFQRAKIYGERSWIFFPTPKIIEVLMPMIFFSWVFSITQFHSKIKFFLLKRNVCSGSFNNQINILKHSNITIFQQSEVNNLLSLRVSLTFLLLNTQKDEKVII